MRLRFRHFLLNFPFGSTPEDTDARTWPRLAAANSKSVSAEDPRATLRVSPIRRKWDSKELGSRVILLIASNIEQRSRVCLLVRT
jgi:hypothetical protein